MCVVSYLFVIALVIIFCLFVVRCSSKVLLLQSCVRTARPCTATLMVGSCNLFYSFILFLYLFEGKQEFKCGSV